jgi:hypothetical protein
MRSILASCAPSTRRCSAPPARQGAGGVQLSGWPLPALPGRDRLLLLADDPLPAVRREAPPQRHHHLLPPDAGGRAGASGPKGSIFPRPRADPQAGWGQEERLRAQCRQAAAGRRAPRASAPEVIVVEDGLASNAPHIRLLKELDLRFILGAKPDDHKFLFEWVAIPASHRRIHGDFDEEGNPPSVPLPQRRPAQRRQLRPGGQLSSSTGRLRPTARSPTSPG